jgi:sugar phosphate isomerase/epimerase
MKPCMWTSIYVELSPEDAIRRLADIGWECFELSCEHIGVIATDGDRLGRARKVGEVADGLGVQLAQVHLLISADVASADPAIRNRDLGALQKEIECCAEMGIPVGVLHPGGFGPALTQAEEDALAHNRVAGFTQVAAWAEAAHMRIAVENMMDRIGVGAGRRRHFGSTIAELRALIEIVGWPGLGICLDTSHANVEGLDLTAAIGEAGEKLIALHVSDNDGSGDQHRSPYNGKMDWVKVVAALKGIGYDNPFNLEIPGERGCPLEVIDAKMRATLETVEWLVAR